MSVTFFATGSSFDRAAWREGVLDELKDEGAGWKPLPHTGRLTEGGDWLLLVDGSVRGVAITGGEGGEEVLINSMASRRDWELAFRVLGLALERGAKVKDEDGAEIVKEGVGGR